MAFLPIQSVKLTLAVQLPGLGSLSFRTSLTMHVTLSSASFSPGATPTATTLPPPCDGATYAVT